MECQINSEGNYITDGHNQQVQITLPSQISCHKQADFALEKQQFTLIRPQVQLEIAHKEDQGASEDQAQVDHKKNMYNRKEKSLQELSKRFIDHFQGLENTVLKLDKVTNDLCVQRRRIYDIINIMESLKVIRKIGKNNYEWLGLSEAVKTIREIERKKPQECQALQKREKSLQYLAGGFLRLFLHWKPAISLQEAAREMMRNVQEQILKTKIRRLYDIINVFKSLGLVQKTILPSKKMGFQWMGTQRLELIIQNKKLKFAENLDLTYWADQNRTASHIPEAADDLLHKIKHERNIQTEQNQGEPKIPTEVVQIPLFKPVALHISSTSNQIKIDTNPKSEQFPKSKNTAFQLYKKTPEKAQSQWRPFE